MQEDAAIRQAIELLHVPSHVRQARVQPLPSGLLTVLQIAGGDTVALAATSRALERSQEVVHDAARFFVEQILLAPDADSYRVLGAGPNTTTSELRRNMALLLRCFHPDLEHEGRSIFARRIISAWEQLKTPERRAHYEREKIHSRLQATRKRRRLKFKRQPSPNKWRQVVAAVLRRFNP